eukprot:GEMP01053114.1.p1 GENE.GEMP01053114.1~~GEMP01053114.1.p1  ORF type:complete len:271 (+),score=66.40 GEMP01053114.1:92-904(+)
MGLQCGRECVLKPSCLYRGKENGNENIRIVSKHARLDYLRQLVSVHQNKRAALRNITVECMESLEQMADDEALSADGWCSFLLKDHGFRKTGVTSKELQQGFHYVFPFGDPTVRCADEKVHGAVKSPFGEPTVQCADFQLSIQEFKQLYPNLRDCLIRLQEDQIAALEAERIPLQNEMARLTMLGEDVFRKVDSAKKGYITRKDLRGVCTDYEGQQFFMEVFDALDDTGVGHVTREKFEQNLTVNSMSAISDRLLRRKQEKQRYRYLFTF